MIKITEVVFTGNTKDGKPLFRNGRPFFMLHLKDENGKWYSKFYKENSNIAMKIQVGKEFDLEFKQNGEYNNLITLKDSQGNIII